MSVLTLYIGSKTLSSWSLRPWLLLMHHQVPFEEVVIALRQPDTRARILEHSPSGKVPLLRHGERRIWESLAICEYAAETFLLPAAWPMDPAARAYARAISAEMHGGFADLRRELPFEAHREPERKTIGDGAQADIARVRSLWREARTRFGNGGQWLFGRFGIADAMFAPVALRFFLYDIELDGPEREYVDNIVLHPAVQAWMEAATLETAAPESPQARTQEIPEAMLAASASQAEPVVTVVVAAVPEAQPVAAAEVVTVTEAEVLLPAATPPAMVAKPAAAAAPKHRIKSFILPPD